MQVRTTGTADASPGPTIRVGVAVSLSGPAAELAANVLTGIRLAVKHRNDRGGVLMAGRRRPVRLIERDTAMSPEQGVAATRTLVEEEAVPVLFGDCISTVALAQKPVVEEARVPWITFGSHRDLTRDRRYTFRSNDEMTRSNEMVARTAVTEFGLTRWAQLDEDSALGRFNQESVAGFVRSLGGTVLSAGFFPSGCADFRAALNRIKEAGPQVVYSQAGGHAPAMLRQAREIGLKVQWIIGDQVTARQLVEQAGDAAVGVWQPTTFDPRSERPSVCIFLEEARASMDRIPTATEAIGYEGPMRVFMAMEKAGSLDRDAIVRALYEVEWEGVIFMGCYRPDGEGNYGGELMAVTGQGTYVKVKTLF